eukprot:m.59772 g.59772  ORF g.59772 m.59772 type:complete len:90 (+) comp11782_c0_seq1:2876-3145(+)
MEGSLFILQKSSFLVHSSKRSPLKIGSCSVENSIHVESLKRVCHDSYSSSIVGLEFHVVAMLSVVFLTLARANNLAEYLCYFFYRDVND